MGTEDRTNQITQLSTFTLIVFDRSEKMIKVKLFSIPTSSVAASFWIALCSLSYPLLAEEQMGALQLTITDAATGEAVPARVEILSQDGAYHVAEDALLVGGDCDMSDQGAGYVDLHSTLAGFTDRIENPYRKTTQFYSDGKSSIQLPTGTATITVFKGPEYNVPIEKIEVQAAKTVEHNIQLKRWINMPSQGWYSADDHLHIPRPVPDLNPYILKMMQAEGINVANLLQMGKVRNFTIAPQHAHGPDSYYQKGQFILAAGQENPRTHFLGHTITLGADTALHDPERYLIYRLLWEEAVKHGGLNGFAHFGSSLGGQEGMAVILPHNLLHFVEVLQFNRSGYETWYDILNLGFRVTPTAGTDYPCGGQTIPGHERFYTQVQGPLTYASWLEGVRKGRTFVTTGPIIEFRINGEDIGSEIVLDEATAVEVTGTAVFDPEQDALAFLELVHNGNVIGRFSRVASASKIEFSVSQVVNESSWFALRGYGDRLNGSMAVTPFHFRLLKPTSNVHSAPIYVTLKNHPGVEASHRSRQIAQTWLARLEDVERLLAEENMDDLANRLEVPDFDAIPKDVLIKNRQELLEEIQIAKGYFKSLSQQDPADRNY